MFGIGKNQDEETGEKFDFGKFRKDVSKASEDLVKSVNHLDLTKRGKASKQDNRDLPETMSTFFTAAADALAARSSFTKTADDSVDDEEAGFSPAQLVGKAGNITGSVQANVKDAKLDKKAAKLASQTSSTLGNITDSVSGTVKNAKLDKKAATLLSAASGNLSDLGDNISGTVKNAKLDKKAAELASKAGDSWGGLTHNVSGTVKNAGLDKKAANLLSAAGDTWSGVSDNVSSSIKDAKLDKKAAGFASAAGDTFSGVAGSVLPVVAGIGSAIADAATNVVGGVVDAAQNVKLGDTVSGLSDNVSGAFKDAELDKKAASVANSVSELAANIGDNVSSFVKDNKLDKKASDLVGNVGDGVSTLAANVGDNVGSFVKDNKLDKKAAQFASNASDTLSSLAGSASDSVGSFVKDNKLDKKAAGLAANVGSSVRDAKLDEKLFGAFNIIPGVEVKNPKKAAKQFRKTRAQVLKKVGKQQKVLGKVLNSQQRQAVKYVQARQKDIATGKINVPFVKVEQKKGLSFPWKTLGGAGLAIGGVAANNARIWSNVSPLESKLPGEGKFYRSRQGLVFYKEAGEVTGDEHPVVFVHGIGAGAHSYEWLKNIETAASLYKTYAFDLLGFGSSERPDFEYTSEVYIKQLTEFLDEVVGQPAYIVASSLAGAFAVQVAYRRPELISKLLLVEPTGLDAETKTGGPQIVSSVFYGALRAPVVGKGVYSYVASHSGIRTFMETNMFLDKSIVTDEMVEEYWVAAHQNGAEYAVPSFFTGKLNAEIAKTIGKLDIPILAVFGKQSRITPPQESEKVTRENRATRIKVLDNARLSVNWERAEEFNALMLDFLDNKNQTDVGTDSRIHELKVSDISGAGFVHPGTAEQMEALEPATPTISTMDTDEAAEPKKSSRSKKTQFNADETSAQEAQPEEPEQTQAQG